MQEFDPATRQLLNELFSKKADQHQIKWEDWTDQERPWDPVTEDLENLQRDRAIDALDDIFNRACWKRIWVVQELASVKQVVFVCGIYSTPWKTLWENVHYQEDQST
jgi:hypothetical protein